MKEKEKLIPDKAILVSVLRKGESQEAMERSLDELCGLLKTAGGECFAKMTQNKEAPDPRTMIGSGKACELAYLCASNDIKLVVFDCELSPSQIRNLETIIGNDTRVIDRSMLILDIFALHAVTGEGKLQVELAQLKYTAPRLMGRGAEMSKLGGGIGTRGPGESQLETDRRHLHRRIHALEEQIAEMAKNRKTMRASRERSDVVEVAIVGYTNAGKSTLLNKLTDAGILAEDKLFATLDPTTRKYTLPCGESILLTDTVGFINRLPHHLISAFHSTLEEATLADILLILIDVSDPSFREQLKVTEDLLSELGAADKPRLYVFNKCDRGFAEIREIGRASEDERYVYISATTGQGIDILISKLEALVTDGKRRVTYFIPNSDGGALNTLYRVATVESVDYGADGMTVVALADQKARGMLRKYVLDDPIEKEDWE